MRRWTGHHQPYLSWSWGKQWLGFWVQLADDVAAKKQRRMWTRKGKR